MKLSATPQGRISSPGEEWRGRVRALLDEAKGAVSLGLISAVALSLIGVGGRVQWLSLLALPVWPILRRTGLL